MEREDDQFQMITMENDTLVRIEVLWGALQKSFFDDSEDSSVLFLRVMNINQ